MLIKTKNYKLETKQYIKIAMISLLKKEWWYVALPIAIILPTIWIPSGWWWTGGITVFIGYLLFWLIQFTGITQMEQGKILFEKLHYEITSQQILIKMNSKQGMPLKWDQIKRAYITKNAFILCVSKAQIVHLPYKIFTNENQIKFVKSILQKKHIAK